MRTREELSQLVEAVKNGDQLAFRELEGQAKPLLMSLSRRFSKFHYKFEFEDFYSLCLMALYTACQKYNDSNPSFFDYAKIFMVRACIQEIKYWNQEKRNIFNISEVSIDNGDMSGGGLQSHIIFGDYLFDIAQADEFRVRLTTIIDDCFDDRKSAILKMYYFQEEKVCDIASATELNYKYVHKVIERGTKKIKKEYSSRYILDNSASL